MENFLIGLMVYAVVGFGILFAGAICWGIWTDADKRIKHRDATTRAAEKYLSETDEKRAD